MTQLQNISPKEIEAITEFTTRFSKDSLRSLFYLFAGKPDTFVKLLSRMCIVDRDGLRDLNTKVLAKLALPYGSLPIISQAFSHVASPSVQDTTKGSNGK